MEAYPAINRWAISGRPLRGLESEKNQTLAGAEAAIQSPVDGRDTMFIETNNSSQTKKARSSFTLSGLSLIIPAASYSPTQLPAQYHRLQEA